MKYTEGDTITLIRTYDPAGGRYKIVKELVGTTSSGDKLFAIRNIVTRRYRNIVEMMIQKPNKFAHMRTDLLKKIMKSNPDAKKEYIYRVKNKML